MRAAGMGMESYSRRKGSKRRRRKKRRRMGG
jgi:hypothetical protein